LSLQALAGLFNGRAPAAAGVEVRSAGGSFTDNRVQGNRRGSFLADTYSEVQYDAVAQLNHLGGGEGGAIHVAAG
jgi:hypothetical protein